MKNMYKLIATALITVLLIGGAYGQADSIIKFDGIDISLSYRQDIVKKDLQTGSKHVSYEENDIYGINSVILKNDILQIPSVNSALNINSITSIRINTGRNRVVSTVIGSAVGLFCGFFASLAYGLNVQETNTTDGVGLAIFASIFTICGVLGYMAAPMSYEEVSLKYRNAEEKKDIMIKSFNKSKTLNF